MHAVYAWGPVVGLQDQQFWHLGGLNSKAIACVKLHTRARKHMSKQTNVLLCRKLDFCMWRKHLVRVVLITGEELFLQ